MTPIIRRRLPGNAITWVESSHAPPRPIPFTSCLFFLNRLSLHLKTALGLSLFPINLSFRFFYSLSWLPFFFLMFIPSLIAALGFAVSSAVAQQPGSFVVVGDTLVSAMMVCRQFTLSKPHR
jgi:hypothetical protein